MGRAYQYGVPVLILPVKGDGNPLSAGTQGLFPCAVFGVFREMALLKIPPKRLAVLTGKAQCVTGAFPQEILPFRAQALLQIRVNHIRKAFGRKPKTFRRVEFLFQAVPGKL